MTRMRGCFDDGESYDDGCCPVQRGQAVPFTSFFSYGGSEMDAGYFVLPYWMVCSV
jgi:hypothetical protein